MDTTGQMVLASRLTDGRVVFLAADGSWVEDIGGGALVTARDGPDDGPERLLALARAAEAANQVVDAYLAGVREEAGQRRPLEWREVIRATGPTVRTDPSR